MNGIFPSAKFPIISLIISAASLFVSFLAIYYTRKKALLEKRRYEDTQKERLGRSIFLDILHVAKFGFEMETPETPWETYELKHLAITVTFCNISKRTVFLKVLRTYVEIVSTLAADPNLFKRIIGGLFPWGYRLGFSCPFRFPDYNWPYSSHTIDLGLGLKIPTPLWFQQRLFSSDRFIDGVEIFDEESRKPIAQTEWLEVPPESRQIWVIVLDIKPEGAKIIRQTRLHLSKVHVSLEFDTCSIEAKAEIPRYYWPLPEKRNLDCIRPQKDSF